MSDLPMPRHEELLADELLFGLEEAELRELEQALADPAFARERATWERAAVLATQELLPADEAPPADLLRKLEADALRIATEQGRVSLAEVARTQEAGGPVPRAAAGAGPTLPGGLHPSTAWMMSMAAAVLAFVLGWSRPWEQTLTVEQRYEQLVQDEPAGLVRADWAGELGGEVVWSDARQEGYMVFQGLAANDPKKEQYQLWIFDERGLAQEHPIDGGVFDVPAGSGRVVIPIDPKIRVPQGRVFAVTIEDPGGVVVSGRQRVAAAAGL